MRAIYLRARNGYATYAYERDQCFTTYTASYGGHTWPDIGVIDEQRERDKLR